MKNTFIPKAYRPFVPGSELERPSNDVDQIKEHYEKYSSASIFVISAKADAVAYQFLKELHFAQDIKHLYYDELGIEWDFSFSNNVLKIHLDNYRIIPTAIYQRHPGVDKLHPFFYKHVALFEVLDLWSGNLIGQRRAHFHNSSKAYQGITSISHVSRLTIGQKIKHPRSFFLKGDFNHLKTRCETSLVVKSCSNVRSKVVPYEIFNEWSLESTKHLPTFFQEKIDGLDIRVHVCDKAIWALKVKNKDSVDYRYSSKGSIQYEQVELPDEVSAFCRAMSQYEDNQLVGIDLIQSKGSYFCLESNPGPGWSTFNHSSKHEFAKQLLNKLSRREI